MTLDEYQKNALRTAQYPNVSSQPEGLPIYPAMGLAGEAGEFCDKVKKAWRNGTPLDRLAAMRELGDVLWYVAVAAKEIGYSLDEVACENVAKLADRAARNAIKSEGDDR